MLLEKPIFSVRQKGVPPLLLPASVLQLPRCLVRICNVDSHDLMLFELDSFKNCNCSRKNLLQIQFASQMWAARPHLANIFEKLLDQKTFCFPVACSRKATWIRFGKAGARPQLAWESQLPLKPCISLQPLDFKGNCDSSSSLFDVCCSSQTVLFASQMWATRPHLGSIFEKLLHQKTF